MISFVSLLHDPEAEVRAAAVAHLAPMIAWGGPKLFAAHLQTLLPALADDVVMEVRSKCAKALMDAAHGGSLSDALLLQSFGPLLEAFLQDEFQEVQLQVLTNLHKVSHLLPGLTGVVTSLLNMSKAGNWRVRQAVAQLVPHLAEARGMDFFQTVLLEPAWIPLLMDNVASVRQTCVQGMPLLLSVAGPDWMMETLLPQHLQLYQSQSYLVRLTILQAHIATALACSGKAQCSVLQTRLVILMVQALKDGVANVRMVAARGLAAVLKEGLDDDALIASQIKPALEQEETDVDCRQMMDQALACLKN